ncbi:mitochondrial-processing peptidase subunit alpha [Raphidocelis subcapitata]|uniref:Mitochondrial-processing peptidase subunit alpha n=1 Tax=Raphidocelis subcapitata TaxID=307507 RepID=A0A2V0NVQ4_9CHLO|nr:mitochondrial-processing peptidase subunit alpha [Raphidocelis subcapitata]|eukprot:GBF91706.1 mitochondrial-processing peptidase subunit alpha [Raphidocelis subcapitata]
MRRAAGGLPRLLARAFTTSSGAARDASVQQAGGPFPAWLGEGASTRVSTPLTKPLPGAAQRNGYAVPLQAPPTEITTLPNGVRIVSEASTGPISSLGIYVNSGSIYETPETSGASALLECLAFKSTQHRDSLRLMKEVELIGANILANASREQMSYTIDCLGVHMPQALEILADSVLNPSFDPRDVEDQKARLAGVLASPDVQITLMTELLVRGAYRGGLSKPLIPDPAALDHLTPASLAGFLRSNYLAPRVVLAGAGVDHRRLVELAGPMLGELPAAAEGGGGGSGSGSGSGGGEPASQYVGCNTVLPGSAPHANLILAFEYGGGWHDIQGSVVMTVLTYLMGGGNSFSSGGPGKGMHSRLYTRVLNQYHWVHSCSALSHTFNSTGLFGIQAASEPAYARQMLDVCCRELESLAAPPPAEQLERAKRMSVSLIHNALESKSASAEDIGRQFLTYGHRISGPEYVAMIESVTPKMVAEFVRRLLASKPSLAAFGDGADALNYDQLLARYGPGGAGAGAGGGAPAGGGGGGSVFSRLFGPGGGGAAPAAAKGAR